MTETPGAQGGDTAVGGQAEEQATPVQGEAAQGAAPAGGMSTGRRIAFGLIGAAVAAVVFFVIRMVIANVTGDLSTAGVGDCLNDRPNIDDIRVVACDSEDAAWRVIGKNTGWTENDFDAATLEEVCEGFTVPADGAAIWQGSRTSDGSGTGFVLCLEPVE